jgi:hypothetical protein
LGVNPLSALLANKEVTDIFFWQTLGAILQAALAPEIAALTQESFNLTPTLVVSAADYADAVVKGHMTLAQAQAEVRKTGLDAAPFQTLIDNAGEPLPLQTLTEAWRRGIIPQSGSGADSTSLEQGIRESRLKDKWVPIVEKMQFQLPPVGTIIEGWLRAQITSAQAIDLARQAGVDQATAQLMFNSAGRPPSPEQLLELYHRGLIQLNGQGPDALTLEQGYLETDLKNKWWPLFPHLGEYIPPPRTVTAMVREGSLTDAQALTFYKDAGLSAELAAAYLESAHHQRTAATKELNKGTILSLYVDKLIDHSTAEALMMAEGYAKETADYELESADFRQEHLLLNQVLSRLRTLYVAHKIDKTAAMTALSNLGLDASSRDQQLKYWDEARANNVAILSAAQIGELVILGWLSFESGAALLEGHGYSASDAQLYLLAHQKIAPTDALPAGVTVTPS